MTGTGPRPGSFAVRRAAESDASVLMELFATAFGKRRDERTALWKYFENPHGRALTYLARGVGDGEERERDGGAYSYVPRRFRLGRRAFLGMQASDAMVDPAFRRRGIFTSLDDRAAADAAAAGAAFAFAVAGRRSMRGFLRNGWRVIGTYRTHVALLDPAALARRRAPGWLSPAVGAAGRLLGLLGRVRPADDPAVRPLRDPEEVDRRFDDLFERRAPALGLVGVRDAAFVRWRYLENPTGRHRLRVLEEGGRLRGYLVFERTRTIDRHRAWIVDLLADCAEVEDRLVRAAFHEWLEDGVEVAVFQALPHPALRSLLRRHGFVPHPRKRPFRTATPFIVRALAAPDDLAGGALLDPAAWYVTDGDRDVEYVSPEEP